VITREGRFRDLSRCGHEQGDLPVVTRGQLDGIAVKATELRGRMKDCAALGAASAGWGKLMLRLHEAGDELTARSSRDRRAPALYPMEMFKFFLGAARSRQGAGDPPPHLRKSERLARCSVSRCDRTGTPFWSVGHFAVLTALDGFGHFASMPEA